MRDSIRKYGLLHSLCVRQIKPNQYELIGGSHKFDIISCLGWEDVECTILEKCSDQLADILEVESNAVHIETTGAEYARRLINIVRRNKGIKAPHLYAAIHRNPQWIHKHMQLDKLEESLLELVFRGKITLANGLSLAKLRQEDQMKYRQEAITMSAKDFGALVLAAVHQRSTKGPKPRVPRQAVEPRLRTFREFRKAYENPESLKIAPANWVYVIMRWALQMDPKTLSGRQESLRMQLKAKERRVKKFGKYKMEKNQ